MITSPFELAFGAFIAVAIGVILLGYVRASVRRGYAYGLWWDFQRDSEPVRFWIWIAFVVATAFGQLWQGTIAVGKLAGLL